MGAYALSIEGRMAGQVIINSLGARVIGATNFETPLEAFEVANQVRKAWEARVMPKLTNAYQFVGVNARGVTAPLLTNQAPGTVAAGSIVGATLPSFVAVKVTLRTGTPGRSGRGRTGIPAIGEASTPADQPNNLTPSERTDWQARWDLIVSDLKAGTPPVEFVVISRYLGTDGNGVPLLRPGGPLVSPVVSVSVQSELGTRVSRLR